MTGSKTGDDEERIVAQPTRELSPGIFLFVTNQDRIWTPCIAGSAKVIVWYKVTPGDATRYARVTTQVGSAEIFSRRVAITRRMGSRKRGYYLKEERFAQWRINRAVHKAEKAARKIIGKPPKTAQQALPPGDSEPSKAKANNDRNVPAVVLEPLRAVLSLQSDLSDFDGDLYRQIQQIDTDIRALFIRAAREPSIDETDFIALNTEFQKHLEELGAVLERYIDIRQNPRYYESPESELEKGRDAARDFAEYVLGRIRRLGQPGLTEYRMNTDILSAQRFS